MGLFNVGYFRRKFVLLKPSTGSQHGNIGAASPYSGIISLSTTDRDAATTENLEGHSRMNEKEKQTVNSMRWTTTTNPRFVMPGNFTIRFSSLVYHVYLLTHRLAFMVREQY
jgi:hypothetical protein